MKRRILSIAENSVWKEKHEKINCNKTRKCLRNDDSKNMDDLLKLIGFKMENLVSNENERYLKKKLKFNYKGSLWFNWYVSQVRKRWRLRSFYTLINKIVYNLFIKL